MTEQELALIALWARADWTRVARSISTGKPEKPDALGGSINGPWKEFPADPEFSVLAPATHWWADGKAIHSGVNLHSDPAELAHVCTWPRVTAWLRGFTQAERGELGRVHRWFYAAYYRDDEFGGFTSADSAARAWLRDARMRDGANDAMDGCLARFTEIVAPHLMAQAPAALFEVAS